MSNSNALNITQTGLVNFNGTNSFTGVTLTQHDVLVGGASNAITSITNGTTGQFLGANTGADPSWQTPASGSTYFSAYLSANAVNVTGDNTTYTVLFDTTTANQGSAYNTGTGIFTAPATGVYQFSYYLLGLTSSVFTNVLGNLVTTGLTYLSQGVPLSITTTFCVNSTVVLVAMTSGDTAKVTWTTQTAANTKNSTVAGAAIPATYFSGFRVA